jgi:hypothetical protein
VGEQTIFRIARDREHPFTSVPNALAQDNSLSFEARGLLLYLLSKPDDWTVQMHDLELAAPKTGEEKVRRIVKELLDAGYMERVTSHDENGRFHTETRVYEHRRVAAAVDGSTVYGKAGRGKAEDGRAASGKAVPLLSNELQINELQINELHMGASAPEPPKPARKPSRAPDPRSNSPAIRCARGVGGRYPPKEIWDDVIRILGESPDGGRLAEYRKTWVGRGYNPNNWNWLLEWYENGMTPIGRGGASPDPPPKPKPSGPVVILNPLTRKREVIGGNGNTAGREPTSTG